MASLSLYVQVETNLISNRKVIELLLQLKSAKAHRKNYIKVGPPLVRHLQHNRLSLRQYFAGGLFMFLPFDSLLHAFFSRCYRLFQLECLKLSIISKTSVSPSISYNTRRLPPLPLPPPFCFTCKKYFLEIKPQWVQMKCFFLFPNLKEQQKSGRSPFTVS